MNFFKPLGLCLVMMLAMTVAANAATTIAQFDFKKAGGFVAGTNDLTRWISQQNIALEFSADWQIESDALRNVSGAEAAGLRPDEAASNATVRAGVAVVFAEELNVRMAIFTGEHGGVARLANREFGGESGLAETSGAAEGVRTRVNGTWGASLPQNEWVVFSFVFPSDVSLQNAVLFADPKNFWRRGFVGKVASLVLIGEGEVSDDALAGIEKAEARRFGVAGFTPATDAERKAAKNIGGYNTHNAWSSLFLIK